MSTRNSVATSRSSSPARLQVVEVGEDDVGELDLEQVDLLAQDERQQQVERPGEDLEVELELGERHTRQDASAGSRLTGGGPTPIAARTSASVSAAMRARLRGARGERLLQAASSARSSS